MEHTNPLATASQPARKVTASAICLGIEAPSCIWQVSVAHPRAVLLSNSICTDLLCSNTVLSSLLSSQLISLYCFVPHCVVFFVFKGTLCESIAEWFRIISDPFMNASLFSPSASLDSQATDVQFRHSSASHSSLPALAWQS